MAKLVIEMMEIPEPWVLNLDRIQWQFGSKVFNILTLDIVYEWVAFFLLWWMLDKTDKKGNLNTTECIDFIKKFIELFYEIKIDYLSADREFLGHHWLGYLLSQSTMSFRIRMRETELLGDVKHQLSTRIVFPYLQIGRKSLLKRKQTLWGYQVYVRALCLEDNSLLTIISLHYCHTVIDDYAQRWGIETLFGIFKSRGFNLEDTYLVDSECLSRLFTLLTIALCWAYRTGEWLSPILIKTHGRKAQSIFRYSFDYLHHVLLNLDERQADFRQSLQFLPCT